MHPTTVNAEIYVAGYRAIVGHDGPVEHDRSKPDGTPRKLVDTSRLDTLGWTAQTSLREGLERTYEWYRGRASTIAGR